MNSSNPTPKRNRRDQRPDNPRPMRETERDQQIVRLVYDYRMLSQSQLERLLGKSRSTVQQSLVRLYHHHYLERVFLPIAYFGSSPTFYILDKRGIEMLRRLDISDFHGLPSKDLSPMFLEHGQAITEFRMAVTLACQKQGWQIPIWKTENEIKADYDKVRVPDQRGRTQTVPIVPDSYFVIDIPNRGVSHFFLELDRGKMEIERFLLKVTGYVAYYKQGGYEQRFQAKGFRVVTVVDTPGEGRMTNLAAQTATIANIGRRFWFTHLKAVAAENVLAEPIWTVAGSDTPEALFTPS